MRWGGQEGRGLIEVGRTRREGGLVEVVGRTWWQEAGTAGHIHAVRRASTQFTLFYAIRDSCPWNCLSKFRMGVHTSSKSI